MAVRAGGCRAPATTVPGTARPGPGTPGGQFGGVDPERADVPVAVPWRPVRRRRSRPRRMGPVSAPCVVGSPGPAARNRPGDATARVRAPGLVLFSGGGLVIGLHGPRPAQLTAQCVIAVAHRGPPPGAVGSSVFAGLHQYQPPRCPVPGAAARDAVGGDRDHAQVAVENWCIRRCSGAVRVDRKGKGFGDRSRLAAASRQLVRSEGVETVSRVAFTVNPENPSARATTTRRLRGLPLSGGGEYGTRHLREPIAPRFAMWAGIAGVQLLCRAR